MLQSLRKRLHKDLFHIKVSITLRIVCCRSAHPLTSSIDVALTTAVVLLAAELGNVYVASCLL